MTDGMSDSYGKQLTIEEMRKRYDNFKETYSINGNELTIKNVAKVRQLNHYGNPCMYFLDPENEDIFSAGSHLEKVLSQLDKLPFKEGDKVEYEIRIKKVQ